MPASEGLAAGLADDVIARRDGLHVLARDALGLGADLSAHPLPLIIVALLEADEGVSDLVQNGVADLGFVVEAGEVAGEREDLHAGLSAPCVALLADANGPELAFATTPSKLPAVLEEAMLFHQFTSELFGSIKFHDSGRMSNVRVSSEWPGRRQGTPRR